MTKNIIDFEDSVENNVLIMKCKYAENSGIVEKTFRFNLLPENVDRKSGRFVGTQHGDQRVNRLSAATGVLEVGWYIPKKSEGHKIDELTQQILKNKEHDAAEILAIAMYCVAKRNQYPIFDVDIIAPIPNHKDDFYRNYKAVSIGMHLFEILRKKGNNNVKFEKDLLKKIKKITTKIIPPYEKESYYKENQVYEINNNLSNVSGKKILLVDDVITQGFTAEQCLNELAKNNAGELYFYTLGTTKIG